MSDQFNLSIECARQLDDSDNLSKFRSEFNIPSSSKGTEEIYFVGNSLGLMPRHAFDDILFELEKWSKHGVKGHGAEEKIIESPWVTYDEQLAPPMANLIGAKAQEVTIMNTLTVNIHFLLISFYNPDKKRNKIIIEKNAFPSDYFAIESQVKQRGLDPSKVILQVSTNEDGIIENEDIINKIHQVGDELALVFLPGVQYYSGQVLPINEITTAAHAVGAYAGFDLAHAVGNVNLDLHNWNVDFAVWCTYKYLNSGPGSIAASFIHDSHIKRTDIHRFHGWWGNNLNTRFEMKNVFDGINTANVWQVSNPPILSMTPIKASLDIFEEAGGMDSLRKKSIQQLLYFDFLLKNEMTGYIQVITPKDLDARGCQLSLKVTSKKITGREVFEALIANDVSCDWRYPNVIRVSPVPLYNSFVEIYNIMSLAFERLSHIQYLHHSESYRVISYKA